MIQGMGDDMQAFEIAYAKVNLALHVRHRRADGYHALESLFAFAHDGDNIEGRVTDDGAITLRVDGPFGKQLEEGAGNLVVKAATALRDRLGEPRGAALRLTKNLPVASGIGGGSADAAATLRLLVRLWETKIERPMLEKLALAIGSDVPACLASTTRFVRGRGEVLEDHGLAGLAGKPLLLVNPGAALSTGRVFAGWDGVDRGALVADSLARLRADGRNDLESAAIREAPVIADVLDRLAQCEGRILSRMSGSGATCFALFETDAVMRAAARALRAEHPIWWIMETRIRTA
ncbi:4-diphosphocytidyl-2-C-methyl-D-erythritol kinase [Sphingobium faniae]|nr:4-diphosphocytidyl-2-C-methyl-D-erythritol kinase [Sphingobium faniae]